VDRWGTLQARLMQALLQGCHSSSKIHRSMFSENAYAGAVSTSLLSCQIRYPPMLWPCASAVLQVNGLQAVFLKWSAREAALWARPCCKLSRGTDSCSGIANRRYNNMSEMWRPPRDSMAHARRSVEATRSRRCLQDASAVGNECQ
jgi:hypothetical protein